MLFNRDGLRPSARSFISPLKIHAAKYGLIARIWAQVVKSRIGIYKWQQEIFALVRLLQPRERLLFVAQQRIRLCNFIAEAWEWIKQVCINAIS